MKRHTVLFTWRDTLLLLLSTFLSITMKREPVLAGVHVHVRRYVCVCVEVCVLYARIFAFQLFSSNFIPKAHMFGDNVSALKPGRLSQVSQEALISSFCSHRINYCQGQPPPFPPIPRPSPPHCGQACLLALKLACKSLRVHAHFPYVRVRACVHKRQSHLHKCRFVL